NNFKKNSDYYRQEEIVPSKKQKSIFLNVDDDRYQLVRRSITMQDLKSLYHKLNSQLYEPLDSFTVVINKLKYDLSLRRSESRIYYYQFGPIKVVMQKTNYEAVCDQLESVFGRRNFRATEFLFDFHLLKHGTSKNNFSAFINHFTKRVDQLKSSHIPQVKEAFAKHFHFETVVPTGSDDFYLKVILLKEPFP